MIFLHACGLSFYLFILRNLKLRRNKFLDATTIKANDEFRTLLPQTKTRIVNAMIFPVILYGCKTWTKTKEMEKKIDAFEMWIWRKMQRVSWTDNSHNCLQPLEQ